MNNKFPPNIEPGLFTLTAVAVGACLIQDYNANEQNAIGNWIIMAGQYVLTNAAQQQLIESRIENANINTNSKEAKAGGSPFTTQKKMSNQTQRDEVDFLLDALEKMQKELNSFKNDQK